MITFGWGHSKHGRVRRILPSCYCWKHYGVVCKHDDHFFKVLMDGWMSYLFIYYFLLPKTYCYLGIMMFNILTTSNWFAPPSRTSLPLLLIIFLLFIKTSHKTHRLKLPSRIFFPWLQILFFPFQNVQHVLHTFSAIASELQRISTFSVLNLHGDGLSFSPHSPLLDSLSFFISLHPSFPRCIFYVFVIKQFCIKYLFK